MTSPLASPMLDSPGGTRHAAELPCPLSLLSRRGTTMRPNSLFVYLFVLAVGLVQPPPSWAQYRLVHELSPQQLDKLAAAILQYAEDRVVEGRAQQIDIYRPGNGERFLRTTRSETRALSKALELQGLSLA